MKNIIVSLKAVLNKEKSQPTTNCSKLKILAADGKMKETTVATTEEISRIIQQIHSSNKKSNLTNNHLNTRLKFNKQIFKYARLKFNKQSLKY
ncbi:hypothetical protein MBCUT_04680 [Methanobrevibacter cuticularis]|uniref:Uncharacterized protein n=1 Tax=Methanobrevibacter cuticularis TaxID=47311 RepID=A0A166CUH0_9EURY|nr:hypothetical protein MBCUT_04680 [Methanobrevibacter cuticularis]